MKVLHIININGYGGAEKLLLQLLPALNGKAEVQCVILHPYNNEKAAKNIGEKLIHEKNIPVNFIAYKKWYEKKIVRLLAGIINRGSFDILHSHLKYADVWVAWLKKTGRVKTPVVSTMHGYNDEYENKNGFTISSRLKFSPYFLFSRLIYKQLDGFILISKIVSSFFNSTKLLTGQKQVIIYHGYEKSTYIRREDNHGTKNHYRIATLGRLLKRKGHSYLIEAIKALTDKNISLELHIYGAGEEEVKLKELVNERQLKSKIYFHGYVDDPVQQISRADIVVIPSLWEGFGLVFLDAFAAGVPVIAFDLPAANEIIVNGVNGLLAVPYNVQSLADNIVRLMEDPALRNVLAENGSKDILSRFSMEKMASQYLDFYKSIITT